MTDTAAARAYAKRNFRKVLILENHLHLVLVNVKKHLDALNAYTLFIPVQLCAL